jgi:hypothetical protein
MKIISGKSIPLFGDLDRDRDLLEAIYLNGGKVEGSFGFC